MKTQTLIDRIAIGRFTVLLTLLAIIVLIGIRGIESPGSFPQKENYGLISEFLRPYFLIEQIRYFLDAGFIILFAFILNHADTRYNIIKIRTSLPFFMTGLLLATNNFILGNIAESTSALFLILAIAALFNSYQEVKGEKAAFDLSVLVSLASLLWLKNLYLMPIFWIGMYMMKTLNLKSFAASLLGLATPYWFAFFYFAYINNYDPLINYFWKFIDFHFIDFSTVPLFTWIHFGITLLASIFAISYTMFSSFTDKIRTRSYLNFLFLILLAAYSLILLDFKDSGSAIYFVYLISAFLISHLFASVRGRFTSFLFYSIFYTYILIYLWSLS